MSAPYIVPLESRQELERELIGGKADGLRRLLRAGFRVPRGYIVTTAAFWQTLARPLAGARTPEEMGKRVLEVVVPEAIAKAVREHHAATFNGRPVAVRSSATMEDNARQSFAGQLESVLGVEGADAVLVALRRVWASYFRRGNLLYRGRAALDEAPGAVAVVVQEMVTPRAAGVMFTADPVAGGARLVISAAAGLGDAVVDGRSTETVYVDAKTRQVVQHVPVAVGAPLVLSPADIEALLHAGVQAEGVLGEPQDIEWALDDDGVIFLQARPITAGGAGHTERGPTVWSNVNVGEALPGVATPMTWSIIRRFSQLGFERAFGALGMRVPNADDLFASFRGRIYLNLTELASIFSQVPFMKIRGVLAAGGGGEVEALERIGYEKRSKLGFVARLPLTLARMVLSQATMPVRAHRWTERFGRRRDRFFGRHLASLGRLELRSILSELDRDFDRTGGVMLACGSNFLSSYLVTSELLRRWGGEDAAAKERHLFSGLDGLASAEPGLELLDMARFVREHPALEGLIARSPNDELEVALAGTADGRVLLGRLHGFLEAFGNRAAREAELSTPRWREQPAFIFEVLRSHLEAPYLPTRGRVQAERKRARQETTQMIRQYFRPGLGLLFRGILAFTQENARLREELRSAVTDTLGMYRHFLMEVGRRLVAERALASEDDVFFLTRPEVDAYLETGRSSLEMTLTVTLRRAEYVAFSESPNPPDNFVLHSHGRIPEARSSVPPDSPYLQGLPASPGRVTGRARVIRDLGTEPHLHPGEILVAPYTDVGWTPLFVIAAGVVADIGGPLSHSAVVAREYGVPAVVNVREATALIRTGDLITVDGDAGRVFLKH